MDNIAVTDTGTTGCYLTLDSLCDNKQQAVHPLPIQMSKGEIMLSTHTAVLPHQDLPIQTLKADLFPGLNKDLLSIVPLCNHGCEATFNDKSVRILKN